MSFLAVTTTPSASLFYLLITSLSAPKIFAHEIDKSFPSISFLDKY